jgi:hypothetical protein
LLPPDIQVNFHFCGGAAPAGARRAPDTCSIRRIRSRRTKIDAAYAAVMAWKARLDAVSAGVGVRRGKPVIARVCGGVLG